MRVLFILKQMGYVRHFDTVVEALAQRGHQVRVAGQDGEPLPESLASLSNVTGVPALKKRGDAWRDYSSLLRRAADYLRYGEPAYAGATKLRARAFEKLLSTLSEGARTPGEGWAEYALGLTDSERSRLQGAFRMIEDAIPADAEFEKYLRKQAPDVLLITPLIDLGSAQTEYVKAARALGIPVAAVLFSWDNLSTKGGIHTSPDRLFVWNGLQKREAVDLHQFEADRIVITGAPRFDRFFATRPATTRENFCAPLGLDPSKPIVAYLGSSKFVTDDERVFIADWIKRVRSAPDPELRDANILIKPHPDVNRDWTDETERPVRWDSMPAVRVVYSSGFDAERVAVVRSTFTASQFLYDYLHHSAVVVGLNTSAELEAGIVGRPVCTIKVADEVADGQAGTLHFHYLLEEHGGFVRTAADFGTHLAHLTDALANRDDRSRIARFIGEFLRPAGIEVPATDVFVEAVETFRRQAGARPAQPAPPDAAAATKHRELPMPVGEQDNGDGARVLLDYPGHPIWLHVTSEPERRWRTRACAKEPWTVEWIEAAVHPGGVFYDVGANVGAFSLIAAKHCGDDLTVVAFEPGYASYARLCDNIVLNGSDRSIIPVPLPLAAATGLAAFKYRSLHPGQSRHALSDAVRKPKPKSKSKDKPDTRYRQPVLAMRLDDLVCQFKIPLPTQIKMDVDGGELRVLEGASAVLDHGGLRSILIEIDRELVESVTGLLIGKGFSLTRTHQREGKKEDAPLYCVFER